MGLLTLSQDCCVSIHHLEDAGSWRRPLCFPSGALQHCQLMNFSLPSQIVIVFKVYVFSLSTNWGYGQNSDWEWVLGLETIYMEAEQLGESMFLRQ